MLNVLNVRNIDYLKEKELYSVFHVTGTPTLSFAGEKANPIIYASAYESKDKCYVLCSANIKINDIQKVFPATNHYVRSVQFEDIPLQFHLTLLINRLSNELLTFNNFTSSLFKIYKKKKEQLITICFSIDELLVLSPKVTTFTLVNDVTSRRFDKKTNDKIHEHKYSQFINHEDYLVRVNFNNFSSYCGKFIRKSLSPKKKNTVKHLSIYMTESTKISETFKLLRIFNNRYREFLSLSFLPVDYTRLQASKRTVNVIERLSENGPLQNINIIDKCMAKDTIISAIEDAGISLYSFSDDLNESDFNLVVVHSKDYYTKNREIDPYIREKKLNVQHVSVDALSKESIKQCVLEMMIKRDLINKTVSFSDLLGKWNFYQYINDAIYNFEIIDNKILRIDPFDIPDDVRILLKMYKGRKPHIIEHNGNSIIILNTELRLIPDWYKFQRSPYLRNARKYRDELIGESIDINVFEYSKKKFYSIGEIGYGMNASIANSPATKEVIENGLHIEDLRSLFETNIIHINQYSVYPYPFKMMCEQFLIDGGIINNEEPSD